MSFGTRSTKLLEACDPDLGAVLKDAETRVPFVIVQTLRTREQHLENVKNGKTRLKANERSKHEANELGLSEAADVGALDPKTLAIKWLPIELYYTIAEHVRSAAIRRGLRVRWGGAWVVLNDLPAGVTCAQAVAAYAARKHAAGEDPFIDAGHFEVVV